MSHHISAPLKRNHFRKNVWKERGFSKVAGKCWDAQWGITVSKILNSGQLWLFYCFLFFPGICSIHQFAFTFLDTYQDLCPHRGHGSFSLPGLSGYSVCETLASTLPWRQTWKQCHTWQHCDPKDLYGQHGLTSRACWCLTKKIISLSSDLFWRPKVLLNPA